MRKIEQNSKVVFLVVVMHLWYIFVIIIITVIGRKGISTTRNPLVNK